MLALVGLHSRAWTTRQSWVDPRVVIIAAGGWGGGEWGGSLIFSCRLFLSDGRTDRGERGMGCIGGGACILKARSSARERVGKGGSGLRQEGKIGMHT